MDAETVYSFFEAVDTPHYPNADGSSRLAERIEVHRFDHKPDLEGVRVALFGVLDGRRSGDNEGCGGAPTAVRDSLYRLSPHRNWQETVDLGDIRPGQSEDDTVAAVRTVCAELIEMGILPVVIGGGQDLTYPMYMALEPLGIPANVVTIDSRLDFGADPGMTTSRNFMNEVILHEPNFLFDYANIGHQGYLTDPDTLELLEKLQFEAHRLGTVHENPTDLEPVLRDADLVSFDLGSIRAADHPAHHEAGPNGLDALQVCQLARYAGLSDRVKAIGVFEHNPDLDDRGRGAQLAGQIVWHILDGIFAQPADFPKCPTSDYLRYVVALDDVKHEVVFLKSPKSDRWWMEVPYPPKHGNHKKSSLLVSCTYDTYNEAAEGQLPDRWWRAFQKLA